MPKSFEELTGVVVGLGSIGNRHLQNLLKLGIKNLYVLRRSNHNNSAFALPEGVTEVHSIEDAIVKQLDFAVICNPTYLHASTALPFLENGVPTLIEKPLGKEIGEHENRLAEIAAASNVLCAMAYCMRYHRAYRLAHNQIHEGTIGKCIYAKAWFEGYLPAWHPWEDYRSSYAASGEMGGGALRTLDHELDFLNWTLGTASLLQGIVKNTGSIQIDGDDLAFYQLLHPNNVVSSVAVSMCRNPPSRGFEFVGDKGVLSFRLDSAKLVFADRESKEVSVVCSTEDYDINEMYVDLIKDFLHSAIWGIHSDAQAPLNSGIANLSLLDSARNY